MYSKIKILNTEYLEKYLLISDNKTLYIGVIVKDIINFLKYDFSIDIIVKRINDKHNIQLSNQDVINVKTKIDTFLIKKQKSNLYKVVDFFNPSKVSIHKSLLSIFSTRVFYIIFFFFFAINYFTLVYTTSQNKINSFYDNIIIITTLFFILFFHELGHSFSAKKFNVNVKEIGFGFYYIFPVFYVNLNESWKLKKEKRIIINLSGIYTQLIIGVILTIFMYFFNENRLIISIFKINFYVILLNLNPFLKFDGYWVVSDLLEESNLLKTSNDLIKEKFTLKTTSKLKGWITLYTIMRILFVAYLTFFMIKKIMIIYIKYRGESRLSISDNIFVLIITLYVFKKVLSNLKNS